MLRAMLVCAGFLVAGLALAAQPAPASAPSERLLPAQGTLVEVDGRDLLVAPASMGGRGAIVEEVRVRTDDNTDLRIDLQPGSKLADLEPGMNLFVNSSRPDRLVILAFTAPKWGTVVKLEGHRLILNVAPRGRPGREVEVATDENTKVMILGVANDPGGFAQLSDLRPDMRVSVHSRTGTAAAIVAYPVPGRRLPSTMPASRPAGWDGGVSGIVVRIDGKTLVVEARQRDRTTQAVTVATDGQSEFLVDGRVGKLEDVKPGMQVFVTRLPTELYHVTKLTVEALSPYRTGRVVKVDGQQVVLKAQTRGPGSGETTIMTDKNTAVVLLRLASGDHFFQPQPGRLEDLTADDRVRVLPETGTATRILVYKVDAPATRPVPRPGSVRTIPGSGRGGPRP